MAITTGLSSLQSPATPALTGKTIAPADKDNSGIRQAAANGADKTRSDQASFSTAGGLIAQSAGASDVRMDKVAALQAAIASNTYNIPAAQVAGKMIDSMLR